MFLKIYFQIRNICCNFTRLCILKILPETVDTQNIQAPNQEFELPQELSRVAREKTTKTLKSNVGEMDIDEEEGF